MKSTFKNSLKLRRNSRGFSLIEVVIGIAVITLIITAAAEVTRSSIVMGSITTNELMAHNRAQEGLEIVRNMRDSNWMQNKKWDTDLEDGKYSIVFLSDESRLQGSAQAPWKLQPLEDTVAKGADTFRPVITLTHSEDKKSLTVTSTVTYVERRRPNKEISFETILTDWKQGPL